MTDPTHINTEALKLHESVKSYTDVKIIIAIHNIYISLSL